MTKSVLVIAAHADDEVLGCGATIAKHRAEGDRVEVAFMTDGVSSRSCFEESDRVVRRDAMQAAGKILNVSCIHSFDFPDNQMDRVSLLEIARVVESLCDSCRPDIVYTHHHGDLNVDHRLTHEAVLTACRPQPGSTVKEIFGFEVLSSTDWNTVGVFPFTPSLFVDITEFLDQKIRALSAYSKEMRQVPHSRSVEHAEILARHRGHSVGMFAAEAFSVYRLMR